MHIIGVTGPIAAGKSTVDAMLRELGADPVIDADTVVHELYATSEPLQEAIAAAFGPEVRRPDGVIDRRILGTRVFNDPASLGRLEAIVHPIVRAVIRAHLAAASDGVAVLDAVKLLQGDLAALCTTRWWVHADPVVLQQRLITARGLSPKAAAARLAAQPSLDHWRHQVDRIIENSASREATRRQVEEGWHSLLR